MTWGRPFWFPALGTAVSSHVLPRSWERRRSNSAVQAAFHRAEARLLRDCVCLHHPCSSSRNSGKKKKACKKARAGVFCSSVLAMLAADILRRSHSFLCWPCQILIILFASAPSSQMLRLLLPSSKTLHLFKGLGCLPASCVLSPTQFIQLRLASGFPKSWFPQLLFSPQ